MEYLAASYNSEEAHELAADAIGPGTPGINMRRLIRHRKLLLLGGPIVGFFGALAFLAVAPGKFESQAELLVVQRDPNLPSKAADNAAQLDDDVYKGVLSTHMRILRSRRIVHDAIEADRLQYLPSLEAMRSIDDPLAIQYIIDQLKVEVGGAPPRSVGSTLSTGMTARNLSATLSHTSPEDSETILRAVVESYQRFVRDTFNHLGDEVTALVDRARVDLAADVQAQEMAYLDFLKKAPMLWRDGKSINVHLDRVVELEHELSLIRVEHARAQSRFEVIEQALAGSKLPQNDGVEQLALLTNEEVDRLRLLFDVASGDAQRSEVFQANQPKRAAEAQARYDQMMGLVVREAGFLADLGKDHPRVREVRESIMAGQEFVNQHSIDNVATRRSRVTPEQLVEAYHEVLRHDVNQLGLLQKTLEASANGELEQAKSLAGFEVEGNFLRTELTRKQALYDAVVARLGDVDLIEGYAGCVTEIIGAPEPGIRPTFLTPFILAVGITLGAMAGVGFAGITELTDRRLRDLDDVLEQTRPIPVLGQCRIKATPLADVDHESPQYFEAFQRIRTVLLHLATDRRMIAVTSSRPGEGKSFVAAHLAQSLARCGQKVLLIDANLARPAIGHRFSQQSALGLSDVLLGRSEFGDVIGNTTIGNLQILACGSATPDFADLLASRQFQALLEAARTQFDFVLIDGGALIDDAFTADIARSVDGLLFVIASQFRDRLELRQVATAMAEMNKQVIGSIVCLFSP